MDTGTGTGTGTGTAEPGTGTASTTEPAQNSDWFASLPDTYKANPIFANHQGKPIDSLLSQHEAYARHFGVPADQLLRMPKADDAAGMGALFDRLGRPATAEAYTFTGIDMANPADKGFIEAFRPEAHRLGISQAQMDGVMGYLGTAIKAADQQLEAQTAEARTAAEADLKKAWGDKYDVYRNEIPATLEWLGVKAGLMQPGDTAGRDGLVKALNVGGEADNPALMRLFAVLADMRAESGSLPGGGRENVQSGGMTLSDAQTKLAAFNADPAKFGALYNTRDNGHAAAKAEWQALVAAASPKDG